MDTKDSIEAPRGDAGIEAPRGDEPQAPRTDSIEAPRADAEQGQSEQAPRDEQAGAEQEPLQENEAPAPPAPKPHSYQVGDRVGLLGRVRDNHDKGNLSIEIESTHPGGLFDAPQFINISEDVLHAGADLIYKRVQEIQRGE